MCYSASNQQKPSTITSRKCNNCVWASVVELVDKISERHRNSNLSSSTEFIPDEPKIPNYVTAARSNQRSHLRARGTYQGGGVLDSAMDQVYLLLNYSRCPRVEEQLPQNIISTFVILFVTTSFGIEEREQSISYQCQRPLVSIFYLCKTIFG